MLFTRNTINQREKKKKKDPTVQYLHLEAGPVFGPQNQLKKNSYTK